MELEFTKMHGAGNDFVFIDCLKQNIRDLQSLAKKLCDRRFGIGADQLLTVHPSKVADFRMEIYNADGSQIRLRPWHHEKTRARSGNPRGNYPAADRRRARGSRYGRADS
jgi:hypothetical protein